MSDINNQRIALVISSFKVGGAEINRIKLANMLINEGFEIDYVVRNAVGPLGASLDPRVNVFDLKAKRVRNFVFPFISYLRSRRPSVVLVAMWPLTVLAVVAVCLSKLKPRIVLSEHTTISKIPFANNYIKRLFLRLTIGIFYNLADEVVVVSKGVATDISRMSLPRISNIRVIYNSVKKIEPKNNNNLSDDSINQQCHLDDCIKYVAVGNLKPAKDYHTLIKAFRIVANSKNAKLTIVGIGPEENSLRQLVAELNLENLVQFVGYVSDPDIYISTSHALVLSSRWEGFPNVLVEAMRHGIQVVSTNCMSGPSEILEDGRYGFLSPVGDVSRLAMNMITAIDYPISRDLITSGSLRFSDELFLSEYLHSICGNAKQI